MIADDQGSAPFPVDLGLKRPGARWRRTASNCPERALGSIRRTSSPASRCNGRPKSSAALGSSQPREGAVDQPSVDSAPSSEYSASSANPRKKPAMLEVIRDKKCPRLRSALAPGFGASAGLAAPHPWLSPVKGACRNRIKVASGWRFFCPEPHRRAKSAGRLRIGLPAPSVTFWLDLPAPLRSLGPRSQITALGAGTRERAPRRIDCPSPA